MRVRKSSIAACAILALGLAFGLASNEEGDREPLLAQGPPPAPRGDWVPSWEMLYGGFRQLDDLTAIGHDEAWGIDRAVFSSGGRRVDQVAFVHYADGVWRASQIVNGTYANAIDHAGGEVFAVGFKGTILRLIGDRWVRVPGPVGENLLAIDMLGANEGWIAGERGIILRWDGRSWLSTQVPREVGLGDVEAIEAIAPGVAAAVTDAGQVLFFENGVWAIDESAPRVRRPRALAFASRDRGLVVGREAVRYEAGQWQALEGLDASGYRDAIFVDEALFLIADGQVFQYRWAENRWVSREIANGFSNSGFLGLTGASNWLFAFGGRGKVVRYPSDGLGSYLRPLVDPLKAIDAVSRDEAWAGGWSIVHGFVGSTERSWTRRIPLTRDAHVIDIDIVSATEGWAVGNVPNEEDPSGTPFARVWRWDGSSWNRFQVDKTWEFYEVQAFEDGEAWAAGKGVIARWDGEDWRRLIDAPPEAGNGGMAMLRGGEIPEGFFGGWGLIHHLRGEAWTVMPIAENYWISRMVATSETEAWAIAKDQVPLDSEGDPLRDPEPDLLLRYNGTAWVQVEPPISAAAELVDLDSPTPGQLWVLVGNQALLHWGEGRWEYHHLAPLGEGMSLTRLRALRHDPEREDVTVWLVGGRPTVARYTVTAPEDRIYVPLIGSGMRF